MKIRDYIRKVFLGRLEAYPCLVIYDPDNRYAEIAMGLTGQGLTVVDGGKSTILAREEVMKFWTDCGKDSSEDKRLVVYLPISKPAEPAEKIRDPYSFLWVGQEDRKAGVFPLAGDTDAYSTLCRLAKPDFVGCIDQLFADGCPDFDTIDQVDAGGGWPVLQATLRAESGAEILVGLISPSKAQGKALAQDGWIEECRRFCKAVLGMDLSGRISKAEKVGEEIARFLLFSEFVFDLPDGGLPPQLADIPHAAVGARPLVYGVCDTLRKNVDHQQTYQRLAEETAAKLRLEALTHSIPDLGERDTFAFEERTFLKRFAESVASGDLDRAERIVDDRRTSIWVSQASRQTEWGVAERGVRLLRRIDDFEAELPRHLDRLNTLVGFYVSRLREADSLQRAFEQGVDDLLGDEDALKKFIVAVRGRFRNFTEVVHQGFMRLVQKDGWPADGIPRQTEVFRRFVAPSVDERRRTALIMVDALRFELGAELFTEIGQSYHAKLDAVAAQLPTATPIGMASILPEADGKLTLARKAEELIPALNGSFILTPEDRLRHAKSIYGDRAEMVDLTELVLNRVKSLPAGVQLVLVKTSDIDWMGESHPHLAGRNLQSNLRDIIRGIRKLADLGCERVIVTTDHGFLLMPEALAGDQVEMPPGDWIFRKRRSLLGRGTSSNPNVLVFDVAAVGICGDVEKYAVPATLATFSRGARYCHEGLSLQECILPVISIDTAKGAGGEDSAVNPEIALSYKGGRLKITTRRPVIEIAMSPGLFHDSARIALAVVAGDETVGYVAAGDAVDSAMGLINLKPGETTRVPLRMDDGFEGAFEVKAGDPETGLVYDRLKLKTDYLE
jgi:hypothetical protein